MGCDIHGMYERKGDYSWVNSGDPDIGRDYTIYGIIGNVRNEGTPFIDESRWKAKAITDWDEDCCDEYRDMVKGWDSDGHSHSYVTLEELKKFDIHQKYYSDRLILSKDDEGNITSTCAGTSGKDLGKVGNIEIFGVFGLDCWLRFVGYGEQIANYHSLKDDEVRFVFFFDN